ncbi:hypothetical protein Q4534_02985 [Cyclobacterium sp. 1_MG-2023]|uniref:hypothetical protein n=1 Tax=Cyclobacterium sp. 1_MG-2023 TaxID=3062681 RepID=UPI0026E22297|nr:hypothetical protein [Cyclobacterium sp. 1_MG-2023]MDO6436352.1 hypothetical protein [Cyclobacterium sp. 1_MG-2023]
MSTRLTSVEILSALLQKNGNNTAKIDIIYFTNPVAEATGYNPITPKGVFGWR